MQSDTALGWETELLYSFPMSLSVRVFRPLLPLSFFLFFLGWRRSYLSNVQLALTLLPGWEVLSINQS